MNDTVRTKPCDESVTIQMLNLRFLLIVLVFVATGIEPLTKWNPFLQTLHQWIFIFHVPLFAFVTGFFAKKTLLGESGLRSMVMIFYHYFVFQSIYSFCDVVLFHTPGIVYSFFVPYLMLWFLMAHLGWRIVGRITVALRLRHPVLWCILLGTLFGYIGFDLFLSLTRMFVMLPFFILGYVVDWNRIQSIIEGRFRFFIGAYLIGLLFLVSYKLNPDYTAWLTGKYSYAAMEAGGLQGGLIRIGVYALQFSAGFAFMAFVPTHRSWQTWMGERTIYVFLFHGLFVLSWARFGLYERINTTGEIVLLLCVILGLTWLLAHPMFRSLMHWLVEPKLPVVFGRRDSKYARK